jgi:hypothetical protein
MWPPGFIVPKGLGMVGLSGHITLREISAI